MDDALAGACGAGRLGSARLMIERGATDFDRGLGEACYWDQKGAMMLMVEAGATRCDNPHCRRGACMHVAWEEPAED